MTKKQIAALKRIAKRSAKGAVEYSRTDMDGYTSFLVTNGYVVVQYGTSIVDGEEIKNSDVTFEAGFDLIQEMGIASDSVSGYLVSDMPELTTAIPGWIREHCYYRSPSDTVPVIELKAYNGEFGSVSGLFNVKFVKDAIEAVGKNARCWLVKSDDRPCKFPFLFVASEETMWTNGGIRAVVLPITR